MNRPPIDAIDEIQELLSGKYDRKLEIGNYKNEDGETVFTCDMGDYSSSANTLDIAMSKLVKKIIEGEKL